MENNLIISLDKQIGIIVSCGAVSITMMPYNKELCNKWNITKEQFNYLKLHFKHNPKNALNDLLLKLQERNLVK